MERNVRYARFNPLTDQATLRELIACYREVFAAEPWNEWKKCEACNKHWGINDGAELETSGFMHCQKKVVDFWDSSAVEEDILHEVTEDASCWLALEGSRVVGFCWGYPITLENLEEELELPGVGLALRKTFGEVDVVAYQDELGVVEGRRKKGIAKKLFSLRARDFQSRGLKVCVARAKAIPPSVTYLWFKSLGYIAVTTYNDESNRVVLAQTMENLAGHF